MKVTVLLAGLLTLGVMSTVSAQSIYKWVDKENVTHFSAQPPQGVNAERMAIRVQKGQGPVMQARNEGNAENPAAPSTRTQQEPEEAAENQALSPKNQRIRAETCEKARSRFQTYSTARRLYRELEDGEREYLTDEELDNERMEAQKLVDEWCD